MAAPTDTLEKWALAAGVGLMTVWGINFAITKVVLAEFGVWPFLFIRFLTMPLFGFALLVAVTRRHFPKSWPQRADLPRFVLCGLIGHTAHVSLVMWGINLSTAFSSSLVLTSSPLWTLVILAVLGAEKLHGRQLAGTLVAFAGMIVFLSDKFVRGLALAGAGDMVLLLAASLFSLYTVIAKPLVERYGPLNLMCYSLLFGAPPLVLATLPAFVRAPLGDIDAGVWFGLFWAVAVSSFLGWIVWAWVNSVRGLARSAPLQYLMPPIAGLVAWLTLGETFTGLKILGAIVALVTIMFVLHGLLAMRKFPANFQEYRSFAGHRKMLRHEDTTLWWVQAWTGFALFFLASVHLYQMLMHPGDIGPYESAERVWSGRWWPLYLVLLFAVELHGGVGLYRLAVKWGWFEGEDPNRTRTLLKRLKWGITIFFLTLGLLTLAAYMKLGHERRNQLGERYVPSQFQSMPSSQ